MRFLFNPITSQFNAAPPREIIYSDTAPAFPVEGTRWVNTLEIREYVFTFDANGAGYWVEVGIGSTGPEGPEGPKGDDGDVGPEGPEGPVGPAATIAVGTVTTGEPGTSVSVSNSGTSGAAVLDFTIPRGAVGQTGAVGPQGIQGIQGPRGLDGASVVLKGAVNLFSNLPTTGNTQGDLYVVQNDGNGYVWDGSDWVNVGQIRGPKGDTGAQGPAGPAPAGTGAVVVSNGVVGTPVGYGTANVASTLVQRDASGNFNAGTITANLAGNVTGSVTGGVSGNAGTATKLATARTINVSGDVTGTAQSFDGSANISIPTAITAGSIVNDDISATAAISDTKLATISTANKVSNSATTATSTNTNFAIVARDANGNFSANQITANLTGNVTGNATNVSGTVAVANGGTGANTAAGALVNLGAAAASHNHDASAINSGTLDNARLPARLQAAGQTINDWNNARENGWYQGYGAANAPEGVIDWWLGQVEIHNGAWVTQTIYRFTADDSTNTHLWRRSSFDNGAGGIGWGAWYKLQWSQAEQDARYVRQTESVYGGNLIGINRSLKSFESGIGWFYPGGTTGIANGYAGLNNLEVIAQVMGGSIGTGAAMMTFTRPGLHSAYFGLDTDNQFKIGGSSLGNNAYPLLHSNNFSSYTDDRYYTETEVNALLAGKQDAGGLRLITQSYSYSGTGSDIRSLPVTNASVIVLNLIVSTDYGGVPYLLAGSPVSWVTSYNSQVTRVNATNCSESTSTTYIPLSNSNAATHSLSLVFYKVSSDKWVAMSLGQYGGTSSLVSYTDFNLSEFTRFCLQKDGGTYANIGFSGNVMCLY